MQVFCPYSNPIDCAKAMWKDQKRYNKQIIETYQIIKAIEGKTKSWVNHPIVKMYKNYKDWLYNYVSCFNMYKFYIKDSSLDNEFLLYALFYDSEANKNKPYFLTNDFCNQHKRRLYTKSPELYSQFANYGTSDENWYYIDGMLLKYVNGKLIK